jgi:hypothetical protein
VLLILAAHLSVSPVPRASGAPVTSSFAPVADTYASSVEPNRNFGTLTSLRTDGSPDVRGFLRFDSDGLGSTIIGAKLRVFANSANSDSIDVRGVSSTSWGESTLTYSNMPAALSVTDASGAIAAGSWLEWDVTSLIAGNDPISFALTSASMTATSLASRESANRPQLVVTADSGTPSPPPPTTSPPPPSPSPSPPSGTYPIVAAAGDIACDPGSGSFNSGNGTTSKCRQRYTSDLLTGATAVLTLGDNQYEHGSLAQYQASYHPSWGRHFARTYPSVGNHEYLTDQARGYFDYFGARAGDRSRGYYSFNIGSWHFVALNSNCSRVGGCGPGSPQYEWLKADLASSTAACTAAYWHHPRFSSGNYGNNSAYQPFWQLLYADGAEIVLNGHDHNYQRYAPMTPTGSKDVARGIREFIVGTGGKSRYSVDPSGTNREVAHDSTYGVIKLTLRPNAYDWRFVPEAGKSFTDSGSDSCH